MKKQRVAFTWYLNWRYPLEAIRDFWRQTKYFLQRGWGGYASCDQWGLDNYLCMWLPHALRKYKTGIGYPGWGEATTYKKWGEIVEKMAKGFEAHLKVNDIAFINSTDYQKEIKKFQKTEQEGLQLFVKYFGHLWD